MRRNPAQAERAVDLFLGGTGDSLAAVDAEDAVLVQGQTLAQGETAKPDVVSLRPGEVLPCGAELGARDRPAVDLEPADRGDRALGVTAQQDSLHLRQRGEGGENCDRVGGGGEQVEVADGRPSAPVGAGDLSALDARD